MNQTWQMSLPRQVLNIIQTINENGHQAFVVGGCVRDALLNHMPHDFDIATSATPDVVAKLFACYKVIEIGVLHGTVAVIMDHLSVEITTYRTEGKYRDHRWPVEVSFSTSLMEDMKRRDFTINALAYHPDHGLVDYFGGETDLKSGLVRAVGEAKTRFEEDALRILRCLRFASCMGFAIEENTSKQLVEKSHLLDVIAWERKREEFMKLLKGMNFSFVIRQYLPVISYVLPEMKMAGDEHLKKIIVSMERIDYSYEKADIARLVTLLYSLNLTLDESLVVCRRLRFSSQDNKTVTSVLATLYQLKQGAEVYFRTQCKKWLRVLGKEQTELFFVCTQAMDLLLEQSMYEKEVASILQKNEPYLIKHLTINGMDLQTLGIPSGPKIGQILEYLLNEVIHDRLINEKSALKQKVESYIGAL